MSSSNVPPLRQIVAVLVLLAIVAGTGLGLYALSPASQRPDVWALIGQAWPQLVTLAVAVLGLIGVRAKVDAHKQATDTALGDVQGQLNGQLDARLEAAADKAIRNAFPELHNIAHTPAGYAPLTSLRSVDVAPDTPPALAAALVPQQAESPAATDAGLFFARGG